jgi:hypothetical protein
MSDLLNRSLPFRTWLDQNRFRYAVLWNLDAPTAKNPLCPGDRHVIVLEDRAIQPADQHWGCRWRHPRNPYRVYSVNGENGTDYLGHPFLPTALAENLLAHTQQDASGLPMPAPRDRYDALLYHLAYHLAETSGADAEDPLAFRNSPWHTQVRSAGEPLGLPYDLSLLDMHRWLKEHGYGFSAARRTAYLQHQFNNRFKSAFYAFALCMEMENQGEMNLFVLRSKVIRHGFRQRLLDEIARHYTILAVRDIPWLTRLRKARHMRGNKWRWGGWPVVAVVVFDPAPIWRTRAERAQEHSFVLNSRQFFKRELREQIVQEGGLYHKHNAMHTTDNEAEAIGHLHLFFPPEAMQEVFDRLAAARSALDPSAPPNAFAP